MVNVDEALGVAESHASEVFGATASETLTGASDEGRFLAVFRICNSNELYYHQVCCLKLYDSWTVWSEASCPGWCETDTSGVATSLDVVHPNTTSVRLLSGLILRPHGDLLIRACWDSKSLRAAQFENISGLLVNGTWQPPLFADLPVTQQFFVESVLRFIQEDKNADFWAYERLEQEIDQNPLHAVELVVDILRSADLGATAVLAAGPLEQLVRQQNPDVEQRLKDLERSDSVVATSLAMVWR